MTNNKQQTEINAVEYLDKVNKFAKENNTDKPRQQTAIEWLEEEMLKPNLSMKEILNQAKEMEKEQRSIELPSDEEIEEKLNVAYGNGYEQGEMNFYKKMQVKGDKYAEGYTEGYKRALELVKWKIDNELQGGNK